MKIRLKLLSLLLVITMAMPVLPAFAYSDDDILYSADFNNGDVSDWISCGGTWTADGAGGTYNQTDLWAVAALTYAGDARWNNYAVEADVTVTDIGTGIDGLNSIGLSIGFNDYLSKKYVLHLARDIQTKNRYARIGTTNGGPTVWESSDTDIPEIVKGGIYRLKASMYEGVLSFYVDGQKLISKQHTEITAGKIGLFAQNCTAKFDNVTVYKLNEPDDSGEETEPTEEPTEEPDGDPLANLKRTLLFSDNFDSGDVSAWISPGGTWTADTSTKTFNQTDEWAIAGLTYTGDARWSNYEVDADVIVLQKSSGIDSYTSVGFTVGFNSYTEKKYILQFGQHMQTNERCARFGATVPGSSTKWVSSTENIPEFVTNKTYKLKAVMYEGVLALYVDGALVITQKNSDITAGKVGLFASNCKAEFDNFEVYQLTAEDEPTVSPTVNPTVNPTAEPTNSPADDPYANLKRTLLLSDNFDDGDVSDWISEDGTWAVDPSTKTYNQTAEWAVAGLTYTGDARWSNYEVDADVTVLQKSSGIDAYTAVGFTVGFNSYTEKKYILQFGQHMQTNERCARFGATVPGSSTKWVSSTENIPEFVTNKTYKLKAVMYEGVLALYVDGALVITQKNSAITTGKVGLFASNCRAEFDNFEVYKLTADGSPTATPTITPTIEPTITPTADPTDDPYKDFNRTLLLSDNFDDGDVSDWISEGGTWAVDSTAKTYNQTELWAVAGLTYIGDARWKNYEVNADVKVLSKGTGIDAYSSIGLSVGFNDYTTKKYILQYGQQLTTKEYCARIGITVPNQGSTKWVKSDMSVPEFKANTSYKLRAVMYEGELSLYVNGVRVLAYSNSDITTGKIGLFASNCTAAFDNVEVYQLTDENAPEPPEEKPMELPQSFDFEDGSDEGWITESGIWTVDHTTKVYKQTNTNAQNTIAYIGDVSWKDYSIEADAKVTANSQSASSDSNWSIGLVVGLQDNANRHVFSYAQDYKSPYQNKVFLASRIQSPSAVWSTFTTGVPVLEVGKVYRLKAVMNGGAVKFYIDGKLVASKVCTDLVSGMAGLTTSNCTAEFDNIVIKNVVDIDITAQNTENVERRIGTEIMLNFSAEANIDESKIVYKADGAVLPHGIFSVEPEGSDKTQYKLTVNQWLDMNTKYSVDFSDAVTNSNGISQTTNIVTFTTAGLPVELVDIGFSIKNADGTYTDIDRLQPGTVRVSAKLKSAEPVYAVMIGQAAMGSADCYMTQSPPSVREVVLSGTSEYSFETEVGTEDDMLKIFFWSNLSKSEVLAEPVIFE